MEAIYFSEASFDFHQTSYATRQNSIFASQIIILQVQVFWIKSCKTTRVVIFLNNLEHIRIHYHVSSKKLRSGLLHFATVGSKIAKVSFVSIFSFCFKAKYFASFNFMCIYWSGVDCYQAFGTWIVSLRWLLTRRWVWTILYNWKSVIVSWNLY